MLFALICKDKPGHLHLRKSTREAHLAYAAQATIPIGGPLLDDAGDMIGSLLVLDAPDRAAAETFAANDPYAQAGLFDSVEIHPWKQTVGN